METSAGYCLSHGAREQLPSSGLRCLGLQDYDSKHLAPVGSQKGRDFIPVAPFGIFRKSSLIPVATNDELPSVQHTALCPYGVAVYLSYVHAYCGGMCSW